MTSTPTTAELEADIRRLQAERAELDEAPLTRAQAEAILAGFGTEMSAQAARPPAAPTATRIAISENDAQLAVDALVETGTPRQRALELVLADPQGIVAANKPAIDAERLRRETLAAERAATDFRASPEGRRLAAQAARASQEETAETAIDATALLREEGQLTSEQIDAMSAEERISLAFDAPHTVSPIERASSRHRDGAPPDGPSAEELHANAEAATPQGRDDT